MGRHEPHDTLASPVKRDRWPGRWSEHEGRAPHKLLPADIENRLGRVILVWAERFFVAFRGFLARGRFSSLTRRIVVFNIAALAIMVAGILYLNQFREGLIDARRQSLLTQAEIIAGAIAESATASPEVEIIDPLQRRFPDRTATEEPDTSSGDYILPIIPENAARILRRLVLPTRTRARLYDKAGRLVLDSRLLTATGQIVAFELPPPNWDEREGLFARVYDMLSSLLPGHDLPRYREAGSQNGAMYEEVTHALAGASASKERINDRGELIVSVAVPIQRYRAVLGSLMLSTRGGDIDALVRNERIIILQVFLVALSVVTLLSVLLAGTIAEPVRRLAAAAEQVRKGKTRRVQIPDFTRRNDEIGELSGSFRDMTEELYQRIDAIEQFAADVAHELKNPLTSLRSAIETFTIANDAAAKERLMEIIQEDIMRIDRLITDISDASRLDAELSRAEREDVNIAALLETLVDLFNESGAAGGHRVTLKIDAGPRGAAALIVKGFNNRLGQIMRNLIDNALSFSPEDAVVRVTAQRTPDHVQIIVEDEGPGIQPESLDKIFDRFHTDRPGAFGRHSGLGLSISRQIVEAHDGAIRAENRKAGGARFIVELPTHDPGRDPGRDKGSSGAAG